MKSPRPKLHLLDVNEPLLAFHALVMRCGLTLQNAQPKFMLTEEYATGFPLIGACQVCTANAPQGEDRRTYVYGLSEGQEVRDYEEAA